MRPLSQILRIFHTIPLHICDFYVSRSFGVGKAVVSYSLKSILRSFEYHFLYIFNYNRLIGLAIFCLVLSHLANVNDRRLC